MRYNMIADSIEEAFIEKGNYTNNNYKKGIIGYISTNDVIYNKYFNFFWKSKRTIGEQLKIIYFLHSLTEEQRNYIKEMISDEICSESFNNSEDQ